MKNTFDFDILTVGHLDVVPAPKKIFVPNIEGNKLYGRGSGDMKSQIAIALCRSGRKWRQWPDANARGCPAPNPGGINHPAPWFVWPPRLRKAVDGFPGFLQ